MFIDDFKKIAPADVQMGPGKSTPVISHAQKFIIPVAAFRGEKLVYPPSHPQAGQPILDYEKKTIGERGVVFFNGKDQCWQAVSGDGKGVIIINEVAQEQAEQLYQHIGEYQADPNDLTLEQLKAILAYAQQSLGLVDMYNSTRSFIQEKMTPVTEGKVNPSAGKEIEAYGWKKRDDRDINQAVYIPGKFSFEGPAASPQQFENGGVIVEQGGQMRGVQPEVFMRTYQLSDGRPITSLTTDLKSLGD